jgi:hypothetical protein
VRRPETDAESLANIGEPAVRRHGCQLVYAWKGTAKQAQPADRRAGFGGGFLQCGQPLPYFVRPELSRSSHLSEGERATARPHSSASAAGLRAAQPARREPSIAEIDI